MLLFFTSMFFVCADDDAVPNASNNAIAIVLKFFMLNLILVIN